MAMTYRFRVSLPNIKGFARVYEVNSRNSLYHFHKQMVADMDFPSDQLVLFKAFDAVGALVAKYATFDLGNGSIENISIAKIVKDGITEFVYFYDTVNKKSVIITLEGAGETDSSMPVLISSKGPVPQEFLDGYVAFEDLPAEKRQKLERAAEEGDDFDDEDLDDEDEEDEDGYGEESEDSYEDYE